MKFLKWMAVVLLPIALVACGENNVDKLNKLKEEQKIIEKQVEQCASQNDDACKKAQERKNELLNEIKAIENKLLNKALEKMNG